MRIKGEVYDIELIKEQAERLKQKYRGAVAPAPLIITICIAFLYLK
jgi:hypothetical protein